MTESAHSLLGPEWFLVWVTIGLVIVTAALAVFTAYLYRTTKTLAIDAEETSLRQSADMARSIAAANELAAAALAQADVSYRSFDVAQQQYLLAQNTAMRQLRAYVLVKEATFVEPPEVGRPWEVNLTLENYGQTPAYDATVRLSRELEPAKPSDAVLTLGADVKPLGQLPIPPRNPQIIRNTCAEWHSELIRWNDIARNKREAYIWGRVDYSDIDGNPCFTRFQMVNRFGATLSFSFCEKGNETDRRPARIDRAERDDIKTS